MKRIIAFFICMLLVAPALLSSCCPSSGKNPELPAQAETKIPPADSADVSDGQGTSKYGKINVDLSSMSGTVAYSQVYNMMYSAKSYVGKVIRMAGPFSVGYSEETGKYYPSVIVDTLPPPEKAGDSCSWFSDRCHGFTHGLTQSPRA